MRARGMARHPVLKVTGLYELFNYDFFELAIQNTCLSFCFRSGNFSSQ